jgi:catechol 2,3-dioxygenase-like lactoylglutathione lyase family enzyme
MSRQRAIVQVGIVVADARRATREYSRLLGIRRWHINHVDSANGVGRRFRSADGDTTVKATIAWTSIAGVEIELIEPNDETSPYATYLRESGPGVHHIMVATDDYDADVSSLVEGGVPILLSGELQATEFQLFDSRATLGTIIEVARGGALVPDETIADED